MSRPIRLLLVCPLLLLTAELAAQEKLKETPYYPLQVGTTWHYRSGETTFSVRVVKHEKVGDILCALLESKRDGKVVGSEHLAVGDEGVYRVDLSYVLPKREAGEKGKLGEETVKETPKPPLLVLKLPPKANDKWKVDARGDGKVFRSNFQVEQKDVKVRAGVYKTFCVVSQDLEVNALKPTISTYYADGVGMVKQIITIGDVKAEVELEKFEPGGK